jgi:hypothetical protein
MMRFSVVLLALLVVACSSTPDRSAPSSQTPKASAPKRPGVDVLCLNDCLGSGASKELCEDRCNY